MRNAIRRALTHIATGTHIAKTRKRQRAEQEKEIRGHRLKTIRNHDTWQTEGGRNKNGTPQRVSGDKNKFNNTAVKENEQKTEPETSRGDHGCVKQKRVQTCHVAYGNAISRNVENSPRLEISPNALPWGRRNETVRTARQTVHGPVRRREHRNAISPLTHLKIRNANAARQSST